MHEMSYVVKIIDTAGRSAKENGITDVKEVAVQVGEMTGALPEYLEMYFKEAAKDTVLKNARLVITQIPVLAECDSCKTLYHPSKDNDYRCPGCKSIAGRIVQGKDITVNTIKG